VTLKDDIVEIKTDVKEMRSLLQEALTRQAAYEQRLNTVAGKVNAIIALGLSVISAAAYAAWDIIKIKLGQNG
jgi:hypothetical protein